MRRPLAPLRWLALLLCAGPALAAGAGDALAAEADEVALADRADETLAAGPDDVEVARRDARDRREAIGPAPVDPIGPGWTLRAPEPGAAAPALAFEAALAQLPPGAAAAPPTLPEGWMLEYTTEPTLEADLRRILADGRIDRGLVIAMDPASGELFAYVASDPVALPATRAYPTASLMKLVTAGAVLRHAPAAARGGCRYAGSPYVVGEAELAPPEASGDVWADTFEDSLAISNNQCFARLAVEVGREHLVEEIRRAGLLTPPAPGHPAGRLDAIDDALALGWLGSGLAGSFISPLTAVRLAAALAHGGSVTPRWVASARDADGLIALPGPAVTAPIWPREVADALRDSLRGVVERGTARRAFQDPYGEPRLPGLAVSGKTGTLRGSDPEGLYQWFVGVAPADAPRVALAVMVVHDLDEPRELTSAAQVAADALEALFCSDAGCDGARLERLHARAQRRDAELVAELEAQRRARELARAAAERIEPARLLERPEFEFPRRLLRRKVDGEMLLVVSVAPTGEVANVRIDESDLPPRFESFVAEAVRDWTFAPTTRGGEPIDGEVWLRVPIRIE